MSTGLGTKLEIGVSMRVSEGKNNGALRRRAKERIAVMANEKYGTTPSMNNLRRRGSRMANLDEDPEKH